MSWDSCILRKSEKQLESLKQLEQSYRLMDSLLKYKKCSILHILTQNPLTSVFVKMSKYAQ